MNKKTDLTFIILFAALSLFVCCGQDRQITIAEVMDRLQAQDQAVDDFVSDVSVEMFHLNSGKPINSYHGIRYYKKPDKSLIKLTSDLTQTSLITSEVGTEVRTRDKGGIRLHELEDSFFLRDLRSILNIYHQKSKLPQDDDAIAHEATFSFRENGLTITSDSDSQLWIQVTVPGYERAEILVDFDKGVILEKKVYSLVENKLVSQERHSDFSEYNNGYIPTKTTYIYDDILTVMALSNLRVNGNFSSTVFKTLEVQEE